MSYEVINFIEKTMKTWGVELTAGGRSLAEAKIQRGIFQGDRLSPLLFIIGMMPLNDIMRKCTARYKLSRSQEKISHMDDTKLWKRTGNSNTCSYNIQSGHRNGIRHRKMCLASNENGKRHLTGGMELPNQKEIRTLGV